MTVHHQKRMLTNINLNCLPKLTLCSPLSLGVTLVSATMAPFLRIAFSSYELGILPQLADPPFCAIKLKEALTTGKGLVFRLNAPPVTEIVIDSYNAPSTFHFLERGKTLVQRKPTMYPAWKASFDAHIYEGRVLEVLLMKTAEEPLAEVTVGVSVLAERCKKANGRAEFWVRDDRSSIPTSTLRCVFNLLCVYLWCRWIFILLGR